VDLRQVDGAGGETRIVHVVTRFARGGSERRLLDALAVPGEHHVIAGADSTPDRLEALAEHCEVTVSRHLAREVHPVDDVRAMADLLRAFRRLRPDVVHTHQSKAGLLGRLAAAATGVPVTYHSASMASFGPGFSRGASRAYELAERLSARFVDRYLVVGHDLCGRLAAAGIPAARMTVVRSSIDVASFPAGGWVERTTAREALGVAPDAPVVAFVGSLEPRKGIDRLPAALARAAAARRPLTLLVAGDGPLRADLDAIALPEVDLRVLGHVDDVARVFHAADVLALPSAAEGLPQVLVQAAMCGTPFVAYDVDGVREMLALGAQGTAVPFGDEAALGEALLAALEPDGERRPLDRATWCEWDRTVVGERYADIYRGDLARRLPEPDGARASAA
jgi:glycosyltransferase involved in cell wall biosynthesis